MAINLARMGTIRTPEDDGFSYDPADEARKIQIARDLRRKNAQDLQAGEIDLAKAALTQKELERNTREAEQGRGVRRDYIINREGALDLPVGVRSPEFSQEQRPSNAPFGPMGAPVPRNPVEARTTIDLARINPDMADSFRTGQISERQGLEDRGRKQSAEDKAQIYAANTDARAADDQKIQNRQLSNAEKQQIVANNLAWFQANTGRQNANKAATGKPIPASAQTQILENVQNAKKAQKALALLSGRDVGALKGDKEPTGFWKSLLTMGNATALNKTDPEGTGARAAIADLGSMVIHDRSGAAVTASESPRLMPFIPTTWDDPQTAKTKIKRFIQEYNSIIQDQSQQYSPDAGYSESPLIKQYMSEMPTAIFDSKKEADAAKLPSGTVIMVDGEVVQVD